MFHQITIVGYLGSDPVMKFLPNGKPFTSFSIATSRKWKNEDGTEGKETVWFRVTVWSGQAESVNQYLAKGRPALVIGTLTPDKESGSPRLWTGQDGDVRASYEIKAQNIRFLPGGGGSGENGGEYSNDDFEDIPNNSRTDPSEVPFIG